MPRTTRKSGSNTPRAAISVLVVAGLIAITAIVLVALTGGDDPPEVTLAEAPVDEHGDGLPYPSVERRSASEAHQMAQDGSAILVDVRDASAYAELHIAGALGLPEAELPDRLGELPREQLIITYCA